MYLLLALIIVGIIFTLFLTPVFIRFPMALKLGILIFCEIILLADLFFNGFVYNKLAVVTVPFLVGVYRLIQSNTSKSSSH